MRPGACVRDGQAERSPEPARAAPLDGDEPAVVEPPEVPFDPPDVPLDASDELGAVASFLPASGLGVEVSPSDEPPVAPSPEPSFAAVPDAAGFDAERASFLAQPLPLKTI